MTNYEVDEAARKELDRIYVTLKSLRNPFPRKDLDATLESLGLCIIPDLYKNLADNLQRAAEEKPLFIRKLPYYISKKGSHIILRAFLTYSNDMANSEEGIELMIDKAFKMLDEKGMEHLQKVFVARRISPV